ncbi:MAG: methyltransferase, partial [Mycoplasma sp.]
AFDNKEDIKKPHSIKDGKLVIHTQKFGDKYKRQIWDKVAPCIHTANGSLASQNTIHPVDNRVFSIAEIMELLAIPKHFKWDTIDLNSLSQEEQIKWINKNQGNIRECMGESVPTGVFKNMADNIKRVLTNEENFFEKTKEFELNNVSREENAAFYTSKSLLAYIYNTLPDFKKKEISILEPSCGSGNFILPLIKKYSDYKEVNITLSDLDPLAIENVKKLIQWLNLDPKYKFEYIVGDFTKSNFDKEFDLIIGNPPFKKGDNKNWNNLFEEFWDISLKLSKDVMFVNPKYIISSPVYNKSRELLEANNLTQIIDFGENGFKGVKVETILLKNSKVKSDKIEIISITKKIKMEQLKSYIFDKELPYWIIYRNKQFDNVFNKMTKDIFDITKNYEISNNNMKETNDGNDIWVLRSKNIDTEKAGVLHVENYDRYISKEDWEKTKFSTTLKKIEKKIYMIPNLTYFPRVVELPKDVITNGSILLATLKDDNIKLTKEDLEFFYTKEYRDFYNIAFNYSTRTLNVDNNTIKFFGIIKK